MIAHIYIMSSVKDMLHHSGDQAEYCIRGISEIRKAGLGNKYAVLAPWDA